MKTTSNQQQTQNTRANTGKRSPEIRDNLDSRKNEEQDSKGDDITHNQKPHRNNQQNKDKKS